MTDNNTSASDASFGILTVLAVLFGLLVFGYGLLVAPSAVLGGAWLAAIGLSLVLSGLFTTEWTGDRFGLSAGDRHKLSLTFGLLAAFLLVAFVVVNVASFEPVEVEVGA